MLTREAATGPDPVKVVRRDAREGAVISEAELADIADESEDGCLAKHTVAVSEEGGEEEVDEGVGRSGATAAWAAERARRRTLSVLPPPRWREGEHPSSMILTATGVPLKRGVGWGGGVGGQSEHGNSRKA